MKNAQARYHFLGVGGIGMSGLAELLLRQGQRVSGSDLKANSLTARLEKLGLKFFLGHRPEQVNGAEIVVVSSAIRPDNPELLAARQQGLRLISRAQMLADLMAGRTQIAVAGAHGKTTTTTMVATVLQQAGLDPSVVVGGVVDTWGSNAWWGQGAYFVAEADESDGSFLTFHPHLAVVTNIDREHLDHYRDLSHVQEVFARFLQQVQPSGTIIACIDDPHLRPLLAGLPARLVTYGLQPGGDFQAVDLRISARGSTYRFLAHGREMGRLTLPLAGRHYISNSLAAAALGLSLGLEFSVIKAGLAAVGRIKRRFEIKGQAQGITVVDDYAHHPTEIRATLTAMAQAFAGRRLIVAFQPHRYSRTRALLEEFYPVFEPAHICYLTDIYSAGEPEIPGLSGYDLFLGVRRLHPGSVYYIGDKQELAAKIWHHLRPGDVVITMGAGDIWQCGEELLHRLADRSLPVISRGRSSPILVAKEA